jgi:hypothetical protein
MNWYIAKLVFNILSGDGEHKPQFDEQYRLISAESHEHAYKKAVRIGKNEGEVMLRANNELLRWDFVNVSELYHMDELREGMELCSNIYEAEDRALYMETVNMKAAYVKSKFDYEVAKA